MAKILTVMELTEFSKEELEKIAELSLAEIMNNYHEIFCIVEAQAESRKCEILPFCSLITTRNGEKVYIAKTKYILMSIDPIVYETMRTFSTDTNAKYVDVTALYREKTSGRIFYNAS